jgi:hypothetical protein
MSMTYQRGGLYTDSCKGVETCINGVIRISYDELERIGMEQKH